MTESMLSSLATGKFLPLERYFNGVTIDEASEFTESEFTSAAEPQDYELICLFYQTVFYPTVCDTVYEKGEDQPPILTPPPPFPPLENFIKNNVLELGNHIKSILSPYSNIQHILELIQKHKDALKNITAVRYGIMNHEDLPYIKQITELLPKCKVIDMSYSLISPHHKNYLELARNLPDVLILYDPHV